MMPMERITTGNLSLLSFKSIEASIKKASLSLRCSLGLILFSRQRGRSSGCPLRTGACVIGRSQVNLRLSILVSFSLLRMCIFIIMLQEGEQLPAQSQTYMKEYLSYDFAIHSTTQVPQRPSVSLKFQQSRSASTQPAAIIDTLQQTNALYLLQWVLKSRRNQNEILYVRQLQEKEWIRIDMNLQPEHVRISGGHLFLLGGRQLHIVDLESKRTVEKEIEGSEVIAVNPCMVQVQTQKESTFEPGISIIYFQQGVGYSRRNYSPNSSITKSIFSSVTEIAKKISNKNKQLKYLHFEVIIPNILALAFTANKFKIYNLHDMQQSQFEGRLNFSVVQPKCKPIVKWQRNQKVQGYNQTLQILIGVGGFIQVFFVSVGYNGIPELEEQSLADLVQGDIINWNNIEIKTSISIAVEGGFLVDMALSKKGVAYYSKDNQKSQIGYCRYTNIDLETLSSQIPILTQEATVWRNYYEDKKTFGATQQLDLNRLYNPSRYHNSFILDQPQDKINERQLQILTNWRKKYSFKAMLVYKEDMMVVRTGSLSVFREIHERLFKFETFTEEHIRQLEQMHISGETDEIAMNHLFIEDTIDDYDEPLFYTEIDRPRQAQRKYLDQQDYELKAAADQEAVSAFETFNSHIQGRFTKQITSLNIEQLMEKLIAGQIRDKMNYFSLAFNSKSFLISTHKQRQSNKQYDMLSYITRYVDYFHGLSSRSQPFCQLFSKDLISLFVEYHMESLSKDIDFSVWFVIQKMFEYILPKRTTNYQNSIIVDNVPFEEHIFSNSFIDFLVDKLIEVMDKAKTDLDPFFIDQELLLKEQLQRIINLGLLDYRELNFSQLRRNKSVLRALLLSNLPDRLELHSSQYLVSSDNSLQMFDEYVKMKPYMKIQDVQVLERCVLLNRLHRRTFDIKFDPSSFGYPNRFNLNDDRFSLIYNNYLEYIDRQYWSSQTLYQQDNSSLISSLFTKIQVTTDKQTRDKLLINLEKAVQDCCINSDEKKLEYYELMLCGYVKLFNRTVDRQDCDRDSAQFVNYRNKLRNFLKKVDDYFQSYKQIYYQFYQDQNERVQQSRFDQLKKEEQLMNSVFLEERPILLLSNTFSKGLICSTYSIDLLRLALFGEINSEYQQETGIYQSYLSNSNDLTGFWVQKMFEFPRGDIERIIFYMQMICQLNEPGLVDLFQIIPEDWQNLIQSIPKAFLSKNYNFINLFYQQDEN